MKFCKQCGAQLDDAVRFCAACGTACEQPAAQQPAPEQAAPQQSAPQPDFFDNAVNKVKGLNNTPDETATHDPADIQNNKVMGILAYIGLLVFIPAFAVKNSRFARFHANQGLNLLILNGAYGVVQLILTLLLQVIFPFRWGFTYAGRGAVYTILTAGLSILWLIPIALMVLGIINAATGKAKELPVIGKIKLLK